MFFRITSHKTWINLNHVERITIDDGRLNNGGTEEKPVYVVRFAGDGGILTITKDEYKKLTLRISPELIL